MVFEVFDWPEVINVDLLFEFILYYRIVAEGKVETVDRIWVLLEALFEDSIFSLLVVQRTLEWDAVHLSYFNHNVVSEGSIWWSCLEHRLEGFPCTPGLARILTLSCALRRHLRKRWVWSVCGAERRTGFCLGSASFIGYCGPFTTVRLVVTQCVKPPRLLLDSLPSGILERRSHWRRCEPLPTSV